MAGGEGYLKNGFNPGSASNASIGPRICSKQHKQT